MYNGPQLLGALEDWTSIAEEVELKKAALAYRWVTYHSQLGAELDDAIIVGASWPDQLDDTLTILRAGPLIAKIVDKIFNIWE